MSQFHDELITGKAYDGKLVKRLFGFVTPYMRYMLLAIVFLFIVTVLDILPPFITKIAIDDYIAKNRVGELYKIIIAYQAVLITHFLFQFLHTYTINLMAQSAMYDLRVKLFTHMQSLPFSFYDKNPVGRLITRVIGDIETLNDLLSAGFVTIVGDFFSLFGIAAMLLFLDLRLGLITLSILPVICVITVIYRKYARDAYREVRVNQAALNAYFQENVSGVCEVQNFTREEANFKKFDAINAKNRDTFIRSIKQNAMFFPAVELINATAIAAVIYFGGREVMGETIGFGVLVAFTQYINRFFKPIRDIAEKYNIFQMAMASCEKTFSLLDLKPAIAGPENPTVLEGFKGNIKFDNVVFEYNEGDEILHGVSFEVKSGESVAIVGRTGSGKTTIINLLARFYDIKSGTITIDGHDIKTLSLEALRSYIAIMQQDVFLFSASVDKNIRMNNPKISFPQVVAAARFVNAEKFIEKLPQKYNQPVGERGVTLSVGQRQLLALARAIAFDPGIIIMDEATSSVDTETEFLIRDAMKKVLKGRTSIIIAHRLSTIKNVDRIIVLHKGRVRETGSHEELLKMRGMYYKLYELQYREQEENEKTASV
ncbi:MAG TPA: antibiotic ABC transporter ATP-binding protein [Candidatus Wallbacteria bacterium]|nr:antibiotic ABC transporter ATP-binding protein [Candidatus Wallbacteria bacterium]